MALCENLEEDMRPRYYLHVLTISGKGWLDRSQEPMNPRKTCWHSSWQQTPCNLKGVRRRPLISVDQNLFPLTFVKVSLLTSPEGERNESLILFSTSRSQLNKRYYSTQLHEAVIFIGMKNFFPQVLENTWYLLTEMEIFHGTSYRSSIFTRNNLN